MKANSKSPNRKVPIAAKTAINAPKKASKEEIDRKKKLAYTLYVENGFEQKIIAEITGISEKSISNWKKDGNWEEDRNEAKMGFEQQRKRIKRHINNILQQVEARGESAIPSAAEGDTINKLADAAKKLQTELSFAHKSETCKLVTTYIQQVYGQAKAIEWVDILHEFLMATS